MKITILGSGGGEGYPAPFCGCDHCVEARRVGGKSIRTLSQTLVNDDLLIDYPADTASHALRHGLNLGDISNILITHAHSDHLAPIGISLRGGCYAHKLKYPELNIYGSSVASDVFTGVMSAYGIKMDKGILETVHFNEILAYETKEIGNYRVTALPAKHAPDLIPLNYIIEENGKTLIYFHDTGFPDMSVLDFIKGRSFRADCVMMDATMGVMQIDDTFKHMSFDQDKRLAELLKKLGIANENTRFIANHITHNKAETHEKIEEIFEGSGIEVSFDGKVVEI